MSLHPDPHMLEALGRALSARGYRFVCPTPATCEIVLRRPVPNDPDLRDIFGWSRPFGPQALDPELWSLMQDAGLLEADGPRWRSRVRFSTIGDTLFAHSAYPTTADDAVFFGPDTYRFVHFIRRALKTWRAPERTIRLLDLGCGSGAGGIIAAQALQAPPELTLSDVNPRALAFAAANAAAAGCPASTVQSDLFAALDGRFDLILMNPPYLCDDRERLYRHGGAGLGTELPCRMVAASVGRLAPGGLLLAYSGAPIIRGVDRFRESIAPLIPTHMAYAYEETDPDVFGEELSGPGYAEVDRIAAVTLTVEG